MPPRRAEHPVHRQVAGAASAVSDRRRPIASSEASHGAAAAATERARRPGTGRYCWTPHAPPGADARTRLDAGVGRRPKEGPRSRRGRLREGPAVGRVAGSSLPSPRPRCRSRCRRPGIGADHGDTDTCGAQPPVELGDEQEVRQLALGIGVEAAVAAPVVRQVVGHDATETVQGQCDDPTRAPGVAASTGSAGPAPCGRSG